MSSVLPNSGGSVSLSLLSTKSANHFAAKLLWVAKKAGWRQLMPLGVAAPVKGNFLFYHNKQTTYMKPRMLIVAFALAVAVFVLATRI
jgi:hypothetical protein